MADPRKPPNVKLDEPAGMHAARKPAHIVGIPRRPGLSPGEVPRGESAGAIAVVVVLVAIGIALAVWLQGG